MNIYSMNTSRAIIFCAAVIAMLTLPAAAVVVNFPDPNLEAIIRETINKPAGDITDADLAGLTSLDASERNISDLTGLEYCVNLDEIHAGRNPVKDISAISGLTALRVVSLQDTRVSNIEALAGLVNLESLALYNNTYPNAEDKISDLSPLSNLSNLGSIIIGGNRISDLTPLANLHGLYVVQVNDNLVSDISPLAGLTNLSIVELTANDITDISALVNNPGISTGDKVGLIGNLLTRQALDMQIPALEARGVQALHDQTRVWYAETFEQQWSVIASEMSLDLDEDVNLDGLPERWALRLVAIVLADYEFVYRKDVCTLYYENMYWLTQETVSLDGNMECLAALMLSCEEMRAWVIDRYNLQNPSWSFHLPGKATSDEIFSGEGDLDGDDVTNYEEYWNVYLRGGNINDFVAAAMNPNRDGSEKLPAASTWSLLLLTLALAAAGAAYRRISNKLSL